MSPLQRFLAVLTQAAPNLPTGHVLSRVVAAHRVLLGGDIEAIARATGIERRQIETKLRALQGGELSSTIGKLPEVTAERIAASRFRIAQLLLGALTEERFAREKEELIAGRLLVEDHRLGRTDTDYRVLNGGGKPIFRINIKYHGSAFKQAQTWVGLPPEDCFALATYKINQALQRQREEALPYVFLVLSCLGVTARDVSEQIPEDFAWFVCTCGKLGKRDLEETVVGILMSDAFRETFSGIRSSIAASEFRVLSASRAEQLLKQKLFERVFALRYPGFTRGFRNAEIDMHFSLLHEMIPVREFLRRVAEESPQRLTVLLDRGGIA